MVFEKLVCSPGRDPAPLIQALERQGAAVRIATSVAHPAPRMVYVSLVMSTARRSFARSSRGVAQRRWHRWPS